MIIYHVTKPKGTGLKLQNSAYFLQIKKQKTNPNFVQSIQNSKTKHFSFMYFIPVANTKLFEKSKQKMLKESKAQVQQDQIKAFTKM